MKVMNRRKEYQKPITEITVTDLSTAVLNGSTELPITDDPVNPRAVKEYNDWEEF